MNAEQMASWQRIEAAPLISPEEDELFQRKLAVQNGWSRQFAARCIAEYRKFAFLTVTAGHPVSPPDAVDQVWHLHLTYTQAYWKMFCPAVLGQPLHHSPSKGGKAEVQKFQDWYGRTLESYRSWFGAEPPDIWPEVSQKADEERRVHRRVDIGRHWVVRKPLWLFAHARVIAGALMMLFALGCSTLGSTAAGWNVDGPTFLWMYMTLLGGAVLACVSVRRAAKAALQTNAPTQNLNAYEMAFLAGGARRVLQAIVVRLHEAGTLTVDDKGKVVGTGELQEVVDPMETEVRQSVQTGEKTWDQLRDALQTRLSAIQERLESMGLLVRAVEARKLRTVAGVVMAVVLVVGLLRLWHGLVGNKPVGILAALVVAGFAFMIALLRRPFRTRAGDAELEKLQGAYEQSGWNSGDESGLVTGAELALAVGLLGVSALAGTPLEKITSKLGPENAGGCGGGCGGNGCGGGGCGGGCGGCGGCGG